MIIRCYGARGSIPVSGREYLKYGGDTTCLEIRSKNDHIIVVDAGSGIRTLGGRLVKEGRAEFTMLFTHSHWDHIVGFPFFRPIYNKNTVINLFGCPMEQGDIKKILSKIMSAPYFPLSFDTVHATINYEPECAQSYTIDTIEISSINLSHPNLGSGYKFVEDGKTFVFITDNELGHRHVGGRSFEEYAEFSKDADLLVHDAEYTPEEYEMTKTWGHSNYLDALRLAQTARVKSFGLFHHNQERTDAEQDTIVNACREILEQDNHIMTCFALAQTTEITL